MQANTFYTNPRLTLLLVVTVVVLGAMAFLSLARQEDPTMTERWARVNTFLPGATASRMESLVSEPIETALREVPEIKEITSSSKAGTSVVGVELYDHISADEVASIWSEVRDELGDIAPTLPPEATEPELTLNKPLASTVILALSWQGTAPIQLNLMSRMAESLRLRLANLPGTEIAESWGEAEEEVLVAVDPYRLANVHLTTEQVAQRIRQADTKSPSGRLRSSATDILVEVEAELDSPERIAAIPLGTSAGGSALRVSDVAQVSKHRVSPPRSMALHRNTPVVLINAKMQPGRQIATWTGAALAEIERFRSTLPTSLELKVVYNQGDYTGQRMNDLGTNLVFALIIVLLVLIWFMGVRSALTVGVALPLSAAMVLIGMQLLDIPLHQMSVTGLIISLGLLIDNAIVVVEDYKLRRARSVPISDAIARSVQHLLIPLGASTATTVFAFMPIAMSPGGVGDFTGTLGVTVALSVASSFLLAMTVVPSIAGFLEKRWPSRTGHRWWQSGFSHRGLTAQYRASVKAAIQKPVVGIGVACILPAIGFALAPTLTQQFFPPVDRNQFQIQLALPAHSSIHETRAAAARADAVLRANPEVRDVYWTLGEGAPRVFYNVISLNERVSSFASAWVNTTHAQATLDILPQLQQTLAQALPEAEILAIPFEQGPPTDAPIEARIMGPDLEVLRQQSERLRAIMATIPGVTYTRATLSTMEPKLSFVPNENASAQAGLSTGTLATLLNSALMGSTAGTVQEGSTELPVRVRVADAYRNNLANLTSLPLLTSGGSGIPLNQLGEWKLVPTASAIDRHQGQRVSTVQAFLIPFTLPAGVLAQIKNELNAAGYTLPSGYQLQFGGEAEQSAESMGNIVSMFLFFALAMAAVVILSLNSFRQAALIGGIALLSLGLALFGVRLFGYPFGYMALIGSLGMMGLAINGAIIVLSALKAKAPGAEIDNVADTVVDATRHIVSTTVTTIGGFVPLIVAGGTFWPPLATAIAGGVAGSAIIALYLVPTVYVLTRKTNEAAAQPGGDVSVSTLPAQELAGVPVAKVASGGSRV